MRVAGQSPTHGQSEPRRGVTAPACKRPEPAILQWPGVAGVSRAACPQKTRVFGSTAAFWAHKGLFFFVLVVSAKVEIGPHFSHVPSEMAVSPFGPWPLSGDAVVVATTPTSLPANAREVGDPAEQICLFPSAVGSHESLCGSSSTCCRRSHFHGCARHVEALDQPRLDCDDPYHDSRGHDRGLLLLPRVRHRRTRPTSGPSWSYRRVVVLEVSHL